MLLICCLLHWDIALKRHALFCISVSMSMTRSTYVLFTWSTFPLSLSFSIQLKISSHCHRQSCFLDMFVKSSVSGCCLAFASVFTNFSLVLLIKAFLVKKACNHLISLKHTNLFFGHFYLKFSHRVLLLLGESLELLTEVLLKNEKTCKSLFFFFLAGIKN